MDTRKREAAAAKKAALKERQLRLKEELQREQEQDRLDRFHGVYRINAYSTLLNEDVIPKGSSSSYIPSPNSPKSSWKRR